MADEAENLVLTQPILEELEAIRKADERKLLHAEAVVEFARNNPESALHNHKDFNKWDVESAAMEHWLGIARKIIRVQVTMLHGKQVKQYVSVATDRTHGGGYRRTTDAVNMPPLRMQLAEDAFKALEGLPQRFSYLPELKPLWDEMSAAVDRHREALSSQTAVA